MSRFTKTLCSLVLASLVGCGDGSSSQKHLISQGGGSSPRRSGSFVYKSINFVTKENLNYRLDLACFPNGVVVTGPSRNFIAPLHFYEAGPVNNYVNVELNDFFVLTTRDGRTRILQYFAVDNVRHKLYFNDLATGTIIASYNSATGLCPLNVAQHPFLVVAETRSPFRLSIDQTADDLRRGDEASIVRSNGSRIYEEDLTN